jgi:hypothetical protein
VWNSVRGAIDLTAIAAELDELRTYPDRERIPCWTAVIITRHSDR